MNNKLWIQLDGKLAFYFENDFIFKKMTWSHYLFSFYFLNGKKNKKENPKCDSLFWKMWSVKNQKWAWGLGYLSRRYGKDRSTPLSP